MSGSPFTAEQEARVREIVRQEMVTRIDARIAAFDRRELFAEPVLLSVRDALTSDCGKGS